MASDARPMVLGFESYVAESNIRPFFILQDLTRFNKIAT